jgi:hypothetical protein
MTNIISEVPKGGFFNTIYAKSQDVLKAIQKPTKMRKLDRKFRSSYDSCLSAIDEAESKLNTEREKLEDLDINAVLKAHADVRKSYQTLEDLKLEYKFMFDKELVVTEFEDTPQIEEAQG